MRARFAAIVNRIASDIQFSFVCKTQTDDDVVDRVGSTLDWYVFQIAKNEGIEASLSKNVKDGMVNIDVEFGDHPHKGAIVDAVEKKAKRLMRASSQLPGGVGDCYTEPVLEEREAALTRRSRG